MLERILFPKQREQAAQGFGMLPEARWLLPSCHLGGWVWASGRGGNRGAGGTSTGCQDTCFSLSETQRGDTPPRCRRARFLLSRRLLVRAGLGLGSGQRAPFPATVSHQPEEVSGGHVSCSPLFTWASAELQSHQSCSRGGVWGVGCGGLSGPGPLLSSLSLSHLQLPRSRHRTRGASTPSACGRDGGSVGATPTLAHVGESCVPRRRVELIGHPRGLPRVPAPAAPQAASPCE